MANTAQIIQVTNAGGTYLIDHLNPPDFVFIYASGAVALAANFSVSLDGVPADGTTIRYITQSVDQVSLRAFSFQIESQSFTEQKLNLPFQLVYTFANSTAGFQYSYIPQLDNNAVLNGNVLIDGTTALAKLASGTSAQMIVCNAGGVPTYVAMSGDVTVSNAGVTSIGAGVIVNADINASAAIDRSKLATGTADHVVINSNTGAFSSEAQLDPVRGGNGQDFSAATGFQTWSAGTASVGAISEVITVPVSWESGEQCNNRVKIPFAGTVTNIYAVVTKALSGTDAGTIVPKNAASTNMTLASALSFAASSALETAIDTNVSANNTVAAGDIIYLTTAKTTVGGKALVSITITRES